MRGVRRGMLVVIYAVCVLYFGCEYFFVSAVALQVTHALLSSFNSRNLCTRFSTPGLNASNETCHLKVLRIFPAAPYGRCRPSVIHGKSDRTASQSGTSGYGHQNIVCSGATLRCALVTHFWLGPQSLFLAKEVSIPAVS